ncbi:hypothetical protein QBC47DRAFT_356308 [Echria macrotheca]|uniref:Perilipin MPL1-like protein n=1 Tax=Echria macrotheca TaxID=438768 RepID=A0AAJ0FGM8_9PEZI|nr:hypothetical protein QBC47DRAFT_356308 [Echria macrotheca]
MSSHIQVNGEVPHSAFLQHLMEYPVVNDGISTFKANPYGQKSLALTDSAYKTIATPLLPWISRPLQYVSPYVRKADDLGDKTLRTLDEKFPVVKKPTQEILEDAKTIVLLPLRVGQSGKQHVLSAYDAECKKVDDGSASSSRGIATYSTAAVLTAFGLAIETLTAADSFVRNRGARARQSVKEELSSS